LDVALFLPFQTGLIRKNRKVRLLTNYQHFLPRRIYMVDLQGNGFFSGINKSGYGSLGINSALQFYKARYPETTKIWGELSDAGDPEEQRERAAQRKYRIGLMNILSEPLSVKMRLVPL
jgi:hypothetical protein